MNDKELQKIVQLQTRIDRIENQINELCIKHTRLVQEDLREATTGLLPNTLYMVDDVPYRLGNLIHPIEWAHATRAIGSKCLYPMRRPEKKRDAVVSDENN